MGGNNKAKSDGSASGSVKANPETWSLSDFVDMNTARYWVALIVVRTLLNVTGVADMSAHWWVTQFVICACVNLFVTVVFDVLNYMYGFAYYDPEMVISRGYTYSAHLNDTLHSKGLDYGFNFYDGNYNKPRAQAQIDKFEYAIKQLGIQRGDRVCDVGCGCGDWLNYLKTKYDCDVAGVNITQVQVDECRKRGLECYCSNWKHVSSNPELRKKLFQRFDVVTFWDTVEHYVNSKYYCNRAKQDEIYQDMYQLADDLFDSKSRLKRVWISCLHMRRQVFNDRRLMSGQIDWKMVPKMMYIYILDHYHSGYYPSYYYDPTDKVQRDQLVDNAAKKGFKLTWRKDVTYDYYLTSVKEPTHFGRHKFSMSPWRLGYIASWMVTDPFFLHRYVWFYMEDWMYQFDSNDIDNSDVLLWWLVFQRQK